MWIGHCISTAKVIILKKILLVQVRVSYKSVVILWVLQEYLSSDQIHNNFVPICFRYMADGVLPVKCAAALALAVFIRYDVIGLSLFQDGKLFRNA